MNWARQCSEEARGSSDAVVDSTGEEEPTPRSSELIQSNLDLGAKLPGTKLLQRHDETYFETATDSVLTQNQLVQRWSVGYKTLAHWRREGIGPHYFKLHAGARYTLAEILAYEEARRRGEAFSTKLPPLPDPANTQPEEPPPSAPEPVRYTLRDALALVARYGSIQAAESKLSTSANDAQL